MLPLSSRCLPIGNRIFTESTFIFIANALSIKIYELQCWLERGVEKSLPLCSFVCVPLHSTCDGVVEHAKLLCTIPCTPLPRQALCHPRFGTHHFARQGIDVEGPQRCVGTHLGSLYSFCTLSRGLLRFFKPLVASRFGGTHSCHGISCTKNPPSFMHSDKTIYQGFHSNHAQTARFNIPTLLHRCNNHEFVVHVWAL